MPELPEVETVRLGLQPAMEGARFESVQMRRGDLRWPLPKNFARRLEGKTVERLFRRGKFLLAGLSSGDVLIMHLGMSGSFRVALPDRTQIPGRFYQERSRNTNHDHIVFVMSSGTEITFNDPRRFGFMKIVAASKLEIEPSLRGLGPEPLSVDFDAEVLARACWRRKTSLKAALTNQRIVAGLGNIYACEALHRAGISPRRRSGTIASRTGAPNDRARLLVDAIKAVLNDAVLRGGSTLRDHRLTTGELGSFQHHFRAYDRQGKRCPTPGCNGVIERIVQTGRSTFYCRLCQR
jgi:formamidopyrimidine-DNA glycosylase